MASLLKITKSVMFICIRNLLIEDLTLQKEEVQEVCWLDFKECCKKVKDGDKKYCLFPEELLMIKKYLQFYLK